MSSAHQVGQTLHETEGTPAREILRHERGFEISSVTVRHGGARLPMLSTEGGSHARLQALIMVARHDLLDDLVHKLGSLAKGFTEAHISDKITQPTVVESII